MSDGIDMTALCEQLVELDRAVAQHGGRFSNPVEAKVRVEGKTFSPDLLPLADIDAVVKGEPMRPAGILVGPGGSFLFLFKPPYDDEDYEYAYLGLDAGKVDDAFPDVYASAERALWPSTEGGLSVFIFELQRKLSGKPRMVDLVRDHLKQSRLIVAGLTAEQAEKDADTYYGSQSDFGMF